MRRYFIAGLLVWLPLWVTLLVIRFIFDVLDSTLSMLPAAYHPDILFGRHIPGVSILVTLLVVFLTGVLVANFLGRRIVAAWEALVARIPLVRSIHAGVKQVVQTIFSSSGQSFRQVLLVEYPRAGLWTIAFLTNKGFAVAEKHAGEALLTVFVPTTPNPTSGFLLLVPEGKVHMLDVSVDDALKMVISLGTVLPGTVAVED